MNYKNIRSVLLEWIAAGVVSCHGDLDIMQDNKLSASNMWKEESDATSATYGLYVYLRSALKSMNDVYLCWGELRNGLWSTSMPTGRRSTRRSTRQTWSSGMFLRWG